MTKSPIKKTKKTKTPPTLEEQLLAVIEHEGAIFQTPVGPRRGKKAGIWNHAATTGSVEAEEPDQVTRLDQKAYGLVIHDAPSKTVALKVNYAEHERSAYVVSLQHVRLNGSPRQEERVLVTQSMNASPAACAAPVEVYATLTSDLMDSADPWSAEDQFTPAQFELAYRRVYGRLDWMFSGLREIGVQLGASYQKIERIEGEALASVGGAWEFPRLSPLRAVLGFVALALVVTLPANAVALYRIATQEKGAISDAGNLAVDQLIRAKDAGSLPDSQEALRQASALFRQADSFFSQSSALAIGLASVMPDDFRSARALLEVGDKSSEAARLLALGLDKVFSDPSRRLDERFDVMGAYAKSALTLLADASRAAGSVKLSTLPQDQRDRVATLLGQLEKSTGAVRDFSALAELMSDMVGKDGRRTYLVIFQNSSELRPTGGFMGSFAEVTFERGAIKGITVPPGGTYALKGQLTARVLPPKPLQLINPLWQFQDSNWSPDFPEAARKIRWFWSKAGEPTIDGVIAVNSGFAEKLLDLVGPIEMPEYGKTITAENFMLETQMAVEVEYDRKANTPKKFVGDLAAKLMQRIKSFSKDDWLKLAALSSEALDTKDIQIALMNDDKEKIIERLGWNGRLKAAPGDFLALIEANIAGQKTDNVVSEEVTHKATINEDGSISDEVRLHRTHNGKKGDLFSGVRNVSYLRTYVPKGSKLLSATGFQAPDKNLFKLLNEDDLPDPDIRRSEASAIQGPGGVSVTEEGERSVFGGWMQLDPGQAQDIVLSYRLPFTVYDLLGKLEASPDGLSATPRGAYLLLLTSQSGKSERHISTSVAYPASWKLAWSKTGKDLSLSEDWDRDRVLAALLTNGNEQKAQEKAAGL